MKQARFIGIFGMIAMMIAAVLLTTMAYNHWKKVARNKAMMTPLHEAAAKGDLPKVRQLLASGTAIDARDAKGMTPLFIAHTPEVAEELLQRGADVNASSLSGLTPMHTQAIIGGVPILTILLAHGANANALNNDKETPLEYLRKINKRPNPKVVELLKGAMEKMPVAVPLK